MDKLPALLGPDEIGMRYRLAHLLLSAIAFRIQEGIVSGAALSQSHVRILRIEHILPALVILDMQGTERTVQLLRRNPQLLRHLSRSEAGNGIQDIIRVDCLRHQPVHLVLQMNDVLTFSGDIHHLLIHHAIQSSDFHILLTDEFLLLSQHHLVLFELSSAFRQLDSALPEQFLLQLQQFLLLLQGSPENLFGIANRLFLALPLMHRDITARLANLRQHHQVTQSLNFTAVASFEPSTKA